ncbi:MAG: recombinase family protein [Cetobacterium sp.]
MRKIGYIRVSSEDQNLARQKQQLLEIGMNIIFEEKKFWSFNISKTP